MKSYFRHHIHSLFVLVFFTGFVSAEGIFAKIKEQTFDLFKQKLNVSAEELKITYTYMSEDLSNFSSNSLKVYSQKNKIRPGAQAVWVKITDKGRLLEKFPISIVVEVLKDIVVADQRINRGTKLSENNLKLEKRLLGKYWQDYFFNISELQNFQSKQLIKYGLPVSKRMVRQIPQVQRGQQVKVEIRSKTLSIATLAIAKEDGLNGERIKLKLAESGTVISGVVTSENLVVVYQE